VEIRRLLHLIRILLAPAAIWILATPQIAYADVRCPQPGSPDAFAAQKAPKEIISVNRVATDGFDEYIFHIDRNYGDLTLMSVTVEYVTDDRLMLATEVETYPYSETQVLGSIVVDPTIAGDVRLLWHYFESGKLCPKYKHFEYQISEI